MLFSDTNIKIICQINDLNGKLLIDFLYYIIMFNLDRQKRVTYIISCIFFFIIYDIKSPLRKA